MQTVLLMLCEVVSRQQVVAGISIDHSWLAVPGT
jgi:hypothetical protein